MTASPQEAGVVLHEGEPMRIPADECSDYATVKCVAYADASTGRVYPLAAVKDGRTRGGLVPLFFDPRDWN